MPNQKIKEFLDSRGIKYLTITHSPAYTAQEIAQSAHIPGREMAKTIIVEMDGEMAMAVLPANRKISLQDLRVLTGTDRVRLSSEKTFKDRFPDCETGAMPPLGNLYNMKVFVDDELMRNKDIAFNAGTHVDVVKMAFKDFQRVAHPQTVNFAA